MLVGMSRGRITQIINNTNFGKINNLLSQGRDMSYIAGHYQVDLALAWALRLEGKTDQEKFKEKDYRGKANGKLVKQPFPNNSSLHMCI